MWWYNLSEQERERFQEMADRSNAQQAAVNQTYTAQVNNNLVTSSAVQNSGGQTVLQNSSNTASASAIPSFGSSFNYSDYGIQGASGQVVNAVVDNSGTVLNYSTNTAATSGQHVGIMRQVAGTTSVVSSQAGQLGQARPGQVGPPNQAMKPNQKPMKDPNAPKKPLSAYFLFSQDERLKVKGENPDYSITEVAKDCLLYTSPSPRDS